MKLFVMCSYGSSLIDVIGSSKTVLQYFIPKNFWFFFIIVRSIEESLMGVLDYLAIVIISSSMKSHSNKCLIKMSLALCFVTLLSVVKSSRTDSLRKLLFEFYLSNRI